MKTFVAGLALFLAVTFATAGGVAAQKGGKPPKIKETVTFAKTWEGAIEEAKLLNLPIVVHSHGFY
jgi:hypothetical protein